MQKKLQSEKEHKRKEYNLIRYSNSSQLHKSIQENVNISLKILIRKYHQKDKYIGIYWPLKGEVDIRFLKDSNKLKFALPSSSKTNGINYHPWLKNPLNNDSNDIPSPLKEIPLNPIDISILLIPFTCIFSIFKYIRN